jgi:hypothetical protein
MFCYISLSHVTVIYRVCHLKATQTIVCYGAETGTRGNVVG